LLPTIINKASKTRRNVLIALITAVILIATSQEASAFSWINNGYNLEDGRYTNGTPCYKTPNPRACYKGLTDQMWNSDQVDITTKSTNNQDGLINQNSQVNQICIAWTCTQYSNNEQKVDSILTGDKNSGDLEIETEDDGQIYLQSMDVPNVEKVVKPGLKVNVILTYNSKNVKSRSNDLVRVTSYDARGHGLYQDVDLSRYNLNGDPIKITFNYVKNEIPVGAQGQVCVENLSEMDSSNNCVFYINGPEHEPESVTLVIPKSR
jgi:hypothetical protein